MHHHRPQHAHLTDLIEADRTGVACGETLLAQNEPELAYVALSRAMQGPHSAKHLRSTLGRCMEHLARGKSRLMEARLRRCWRLRHEPPPFDQPRVFCISDVHVDQGENMHRLQSLSTSAFQGDVLIVAGDVADSMSGVKTALQLLRSRFARVVFCSGNHDLWLREGLADAYQHPDSLAKLLALHSLCDDLDVDTTPMRVRPDVIIVPLNSWYHYSYDKHDPRPGRLRFDRFCRWPVDDQEAVWQLMLALNRPALAWTAGHARESAGDESGMGAGEGEDGAPFMHQTHTASSGSGVDLAQQRLHSRRSGGACALLADEQTQRTRMSRHTTVHRNGGQADALLPALQRCTISRHPAGFRTSRDGASSGPPIVITASHFLPALHLPFNNMVPELAKAVGCLQLSNQLDTLHSSVHVYGHTHVPADVDLPLTGGVPAHGAHKHGHGHTHGHGSAHHTTTTSADGQSGVGCCTAHSRRRHVHNPMDGAHNPGLVCVWDMEAGTGARYMVNFDGKVMTERWVSP